MDRDSVIAFAFVQDWVVLGVSRLGELVKKNVAQGEKVDGG